MFLVKLELFVERNYSTTILLIYHVANTNYVKIRINKYSRVNLDNLRHTIRPLLSAVLGRTKFWSQKNRGFNSYCTSHKLGVPNFGLKNCG